MTHTLSSASGLEGEQLNTAIERIRFNSIMYVGFPGVQGNHENNLKRLLRDVFDKLGLDGFMSTWHSPSLTSDPIKIPREAVTILRGSGYSIPELRVSNLHSAILSKCQVTMVNRLTLRYGVGREVA